MSNYQFGPDAQIRSVSLRLPMSSVVIHKREDECRNNK